MLNRSRIEQQYIFLDESGKPEVYSSKGMNLVKSGAASKYLVLSAVRMTDHLAVQAQTLDFKKTLLNDATLTKIFSPAYSLDSFHANVDYPQVKERFYLFINQLADIKIDVIVVEKLKCYPSLRENPGKLYGVMAGQLLCNLCHQAKKTEIIFSRKDSKLRLRTELEVEVDRVRLAYMDQRPNLSTSVKLNYQHNPHYSHAGLQIADYIAYAVFKVFESGDRRWYQLIQNKIGKIHDICNRKYFTKSNPL